MSAMGAMRRRATTQSTELEEYHSRGLQHWRGVRNAPVGVHPGLLLRRAEAERRRRFPRPPAGLEGADCEEVGGAERMDRAALLEADAPERREGGGGDVGGGNPRRRPLAEGVERRGKVGGVLVRCQQSVCHRHHRLRCGDYGGADVPTCLMALCLDV